MKNHSLFKLFKSKSLDGLEGLTEVPDRNSPSWFAAPAQHFQIISPGRSGTRWLANVLLESTKSFVIHATPKTLAEPGFLYHQGKISADEILGAYRQSRSFHLGMAKSFNRPLFDLDCKNTPITKVLARNFPALRFIIQIRDPIAFVKSGLNRGYFSSKDPQAWGHLTAAHSTTNNYKTETERAAYKIADFWRLTVDIASNTYKDHPERVFFLDASKLFIDPITVDSLLNELQIPHLKTTTLRSFKRKVNKNKYSHKLTPEQNDILSSSIFHDYCLHDIEQNIMEKLGWLK